ncbi:MAG: hypothetical protein HZC24_11000 [Rhodocyclales bacterium]|nr:hypothetical protein [Rhodocyclales bacterium]
MPKKSASLKLPLECAEITNPANTISSPARRAATGRQATKPSSTRAKPNPQAFLPGLSRRGRPRSAVPSSASQRAALSRRRRLDNGGKRLEFIVDADSVAKLDRLADHQKESRSEVLIGLIAKAAARLSRK